MMCSDKNIKMWDCGGIAIVSVLACNGCNVAMCVSNPLNFTPMMCNAGVMVVRIWKLHSMHIFVPYLITLRGTNWIRGHHPPSRPSLPWPGHMCTYLHVIPRSNSRLYYCGVSLKTISRADIYVTGHNGSQSQPGYLPVRLEKSEKRNLDIHLVLCSDSGSQLFKVYGPSVCESLCADVWCTILPTE